MTQDLEQLFSLLDTLIRLHEQMIATLDRQLAAARAADSETMQQCQQQTEDLVRQVARAEAERRALSRRLAAGAGIAGAEQGRGVTASRLAGALPEPIRGRLLAQAAQLRQRIQEVDRLNKILADVSRYVLQHLRSAYDTVARMAGTTGVYAANGKMREAQRSTVFEVMG
jgi:hypothetical protein